MAKLRKDLVGVVYVAGGVYAAGDVLPTGADVAASLVAAEPVTAPAPRKRRQVKREEATDVGDS